MWVYFSYAYEYAMRVFFFFWYMCLGCLSVMIRCCWFFYASLRLCCTFILRKHAHSWRVRCFGVFVSGWGVFDCAFFAFALQLAFIGFGGCSWVLSVYCVYGFVCAVCFFFLALCACLVCVADGIIVWCRCFARPGSWVIAFLRCFFFSFLLLC